MATGDNNVFIETSSCVLIAVPLGGASGCAIVTGVPSIVTTGWTSIALTNEIEAGTDYSQKGANGKQCGPRLVGDDVIKWKNVAGTLCVKNLALFSMLSGDPVVVDADDHIVGIEHLIGGASASGSVCDAASNKPKVAMFIGRKASDSDGGCGASASTSGAARASTASAVVAAVRSRVSSLACRVARGAPLPASKRLTRNWNWPDRVL